MNRIWLLATIGGCTVLLIAGAFALLQTIIHEKHRTTRVQLARGQAPLPAEAQQEVVKNVWERVLAAFGRSILRIGILSARTRAELELTLASSGLRGRTGLEVFIGSKIGMLVSVPLLGMLLQREIHLPSILYIPMIRNVLFLVLAVVGLLLPDIVVRWQRKKYIQRVKLGLPDALDLLKCRSGLRPLDWNWHRPPPSWRSWTAGRHCRTWDRAPASRDWFGWRALFYNRCSTARR
jgi:Flp pilus assembly protein TadB